MYPYGHEPFPIDVLNLMGINYLSGNNEAFCSSPPNTTNFLGPKLKLRVSPVEKTLHAVLIYDSTSVNAVVIVLPCYDITRILDLINA